MFSDNLRFQICLHIQFDFRRFRTRTDLEKVVQSEINVQPDGEQAKRDKLLRIKYQADRLTKSTKARRISD